MILDLNRFSSELFKNDQGFWSGAETKNISYPETGHGSCYQVEDNSFWFRHRNNCIKAVIELFPPQHEIWDIGGGNGFVAKFLQEQGYPTVLLEPGFSGASNAQKRGVSNVICGDITATKFYKNSFSSVGLFDVIEHIANENEFLNELRIHLKENGRLYLTTPAYQFLWSADDVFAGHHRRYTIEKLKVVLAKNGFKTNFASYIFAPLPIPIFFLRTIPFLLLNRNVESSSVASDHKTSDSVSKKVLLKILNQEVQQIKKSKSIPFGGSIILVAEKI